MKICLDAGHRTGQNQSPARCGYFEGDRMFTLQRLLQQELEAYGVTVVCTRAARQDDPPLYTRALAAKDCDLFLSLHSNAAGNGVCESVDYPVVFYPVSGKGIGLLPSWRSASIRRWERCSPRRRASAGTARTTPIITGSSASRQPSA